MYYIKSENNFIFINGSTYISFNNDDKEGYYQAYLAWVAEGNTAEEWSSNAD